MRLVAVVCALGLAITSNTTSTNTSITARTDATRTGNTVTSKQYVGPTRCGECHPDEAARWRTSLHPVMNAKVDDVGAVIGAFDGRTLAHAGGTARFDHDGGVYTMTLSRGATTTRYRVTRTIGHRALQEYVGIELSGSASRATSASAPIEVRLPFGWWPRHGGWAAQSDFDPWLDGSFDAYTPVREPWAERCPWCHSTYPFEQRIARASTPARTGHGLEQFFLGTPHDHADTLDVAAQVTTGISCESCHLGGRQHAQGEPIHLVPLVDGTATPRRDAPRPSRFASERRDPSIVNGTCAQCHSGPSPKLADGTSLRNSSESLDLGRSPCNGITCIDCHDPHRGESHATIADTEMRATRACVRCHERLRDPDTARRHASAGGSGHDAIDCLDCHMPRVVMGIDHYVRTHRISSPATSLEVNACNLCHLDRSFGWTAAMLADRFGTPTKLRGDTEAGRMWLASKRPSIRLLAAAAYTRSPLGQSMGEQIAAGLTDQLPYVRAWTRLLLDDLRAAASK